MLQSIKIGLIWLLWLEIGEGYWFLLWPNGWKPLSHFKPKLKPSIGQLNEPWSLCGGHSWRIAVLIANTIRLTNLSQNIQFNRVPREANGAVHYLAIWSLSNKLADSFVLDSIPQVISNVVIALHISWKFNLVCTVSAILIK